MSRKRLGIVGATLAAVGGLAAALLVGPSSGSAGSPSTVAVNYLPDAGFHQTSLQGSSDEIAKMLADRLAGTAVTRIEVAGPPDDFLPVDDNGDPLANRPADPHWIFVTVEVAEVRSAETALAVWEADLAVGALRDALARAGEVVEGTRIRVAASDGSAHDVSAGPGEVAVGQDFEMSNEPITLDSAQEAADQFGIVVKSVDTITAEQTAVALKIETKTPKDTLRRWNEIVAEFFGQTPRFEGFFLQAETPSGELVALETAAFRSRAGRTYFNPAFADEPSLFSPAEP